MELQKENLAEVALNSEDRVMPVHRALAVLYIVLTNVIGWWLTYKILNWSILKLTSWSQTMALVFSALLFLYSVVAIAVFIFLVESFILGNRVDKIQNKYDFLLYSLSLAKDFSFFLICFLSFAYLGWEIQLEWPNAFIGQDASDLKSWILYSFLMFARLIDADVLKFYGVTMPDIQAIGLLSKSLMAFFQLYLKFVLIGVLFRLFRLLLK